MFALCYSWRVYIYRQCLKTMCWFQGWMKKIKWWPRCFSRCYSNNGHVWFEPMASMSWRRRRLSEHSRLPSRHHRNEERRTKKWFKALLHELAPKGRSLIAHEKTKSRYGHHQGRMDVWRCAQEEALPELSMGEQFARLRQASAIKKDITSWGEQDRRHQDQVECARQMFVLDRFSILPVSWC